MKPEENPPVGRILFTEKGVAEAHYALDSLPNKVLAAEYRTALPDEKLALRKNLVDALILQGFHEAGIPAARSVGAAQLL